ncbi:hypothetical protein BRARA_G00726 [Brassica rapa]|uniref:Uncharacterized protein n=1 Tax=Brassica campestris TaxID=3711 RepID=A0A397YMZ7_BRACM|nr:hypothetical protein BRARA_G00726 [Brassica rapa]RID53324.1 hypothetical protein BRARA_G00726 [Brassica rapa]
MFKFKTQLYEFESMSGYNYTKLPKVFVVSLSLASPLFLHGSIFHLLHPLRDDAVTDPLIKPSLITHTRSPFDATLESARRWKSTIKRYEFMLS